MSTRATVFWTQATFRQLLACMANPGRLGQVTVGHLWPLARGRYLEAVLATLIDREVTCWVGGTGLAESDRLQVGRYLSFCLGGRVVEQDEADFLVWLVSPSAGDLERVKKGSLEFPEEAATLICAVERILSSHEAGVYAGGDGEGGNSGAVSSLIMEGPGIAGQACVSVVGLDVAFFQKLAEINRGFPLGLDLIVVDEVGRLACLPRSSRLIGL